VTFKKAKWAEQVTLAGKGPALTSRALHTPLPMAKTEGGIFGEALVAHPNLGGDLMFMPGSTGFKPHTHEGHHLIFVVSGECTVTVEAEIHRMLAGEVCLIPGAVAHAVSAVSDTMLLAVGTPHMPVNAEDRLELVPFEVLAVKLSDHIRCMGCSVHRLYERAEILGDDGVVRCPSMRADGKCSLERTVHRHGADHDHDNT
jgi:quercetin dioxygenase-like cupin family protein